MAHRILVASYTNDIVTLLFDPAAKTLSVEASLAVGYRPSWVTPYPGDNSLIFTGLEQSDGKVVAIKFDYENKKAEVVKEVQSAGADPCSLLATEDQLFVANYSGGTVAIYPISKSAPYILTSVPSQIIRLHGTGPNKSRQESAHPHQVILHEPSKELLVPDLAADRVIRYSRSGNGEWAEVGHIAYQPGGGPRHVAYSDDDLFTILELTNHVAHHKFNPLTIPIPKHIATKATMSNPVPQPNDMLAAEILLPQAGTTFPAKHLYLSNRNDPSPEGDIISIFRVPAPDVAGEQMTLVGEVRTGLRHVRGIQLGGEEDKYLIAGGALSDGVKVYERVEGGKALREVVENKEVKAPTGFLWV